MHLNHQVQSVYTKKNFVVGVKFHKFILLYQNKHHAFFNDDFEGELRFETYFLLTRSFFFPTNSRVIFYRNTIHIFSRNLNKAMILIHH
jgi:hypothetical protein